MKQQDHYLPRGWRTWATVRLEALEGELAARGGFEGELADLVAYELEQRYAAEQDERVAQGIGAWPVRR